MKTSLLLIVFVFAVSSFNYSSCRNKEIDVNLISDNQGLNVNFNDSSFQTGNRDDANYSGSYKGIYFFEDDGATERKEIFPIIMINDTCSYFYFEKVLITNFSIEENLISFNKIGDYNDGCGGCYIFYGERFNLVFEKIKGEYKVVTFAAWG